MQTRMQPGPLNDLCGVMTTKVGLHICGRVYSSLRGIPQANEEVWDLGGSAQSSHDSYPPKHRTLSCVLSLLSGWATQINLHAIRVRFLFRLSRPAMHFTHCLRVCRDKG
jgi:hypothetical protein